MGQLLYGAFDLGQKMSGVRDYQLVFAGAGQRDIQARGRFLRVLEATGDVFLKIDSGSEVTRVKGRGINALDPFSVITVRSAIAQTVVLVVSDVPQDDDQTNVAATVTATVAPGASVGAGGDVSIPATTTQLLAAGDAARLSLIVRNPSANTDGIRVGGLGVGAASGILIDPGESISLDTTAAVYGYNTGAGAQDVNVLPVNA